MKMLKSLTFAVMSRGSQNPVLARRAKLIHRLEQQNDLRKTRTLLRRSRSGCVTMRGVRNSFNSKSGYVLGGARTHLGLLD